ncbi:uncharacterized protein LOC143246963 [Tachypleus tridentatus]|uniref:uncharacterized protein LOC143246963 n=1 Tax=Tachypleus tridentatus TaxID=6853 RepID=UPI003FD4D955
MKLFFALVLLTVCSVALSGYSYGYNTGTSSVNVNQDYGLPYTGHYRYHNYVRPVYYTGHRNLPYSYGLGQNYGLGYVGVGYNYVPRYYSGLGYNQGLNYYGYVQKPVGYSSYNYMY